jgi:uncharacterized protein (TIGR02145 family)
MVLAAQSDMAAPDIPAESGTAGLTFTAFNPAPTATTGDVWNLTDPRDGHTYMVRKLADGHYWMVQDLRFGQCTDRSFTTGTLYRGSKGHCRTNTQPGAGYLYDWTAVAQEANLCPSGWHVPTAEEYRTADAVFQQEYDCNSYQCWSSEAFWAGVPTDFCNEHGVPLYHPGEIVHWTASPYSGDAAYCFVSQPGRASLNLFVKRGYGMAVRCVRNNYEL